MQVEPGRGSLWSCPVMRLLNLLLIVPVLLAADCGGRSSLDELTIFYLGGAPTYGGDNNKGGMVAFSGYPATGGKSVGVPSGGISAMGGTRQAGGLPSAGGARTTGGSNGSGACCLAIS